MMMASLLLLFLLPTVWCFVVPTTKWHPTTTTALQRPLDNFKNLGPISFDSLRSPHTTTALQMADAASAASLDLKTVGIVVACIAPIAAVLSGRLAASSRESFQQEIRRTESDLEGFKEELKKSDDLAVATYATAAVSFAVALIYLVGLNGPNTSSLPSTTVATTPSGPSVVAPVPPLTYPQPMMKAYEPLSKTMDSGQVLTTNQVRDLFGKWNNALLSGDSDAVARRYARDAVLLPTKSDVPRNNYESIKDYFDKFLVKKPSGKILSSYVSTGNNWASDVGIYEFTFGTDGSKVRARYSFVYTLEDDGSWKISHHHSSQMPEEVAPIRPITVSQVRGLFDLWNNALLTGNPDQVVKRYAKDAVLLPTLSGTPRTTDALIRDYFVGFLKKQPSGVITEGYITIGTDWAQDAGNYVFTLGDGSKVKARYSFIYVYEDGEWKISHHHSSLMPEAPVA